MKFDYNGLVYKVDNYLRKKRQQSRIWAAALPEKLFSPSLWELEPRSVAMGAAWGTSWALAPVPMQTIFAVLSSIWTRGNIPVSVLSCCISFPGYQIVAWPLQWYVGAVVMSGLSMGSGVNMELMKEAAAAMPQGADAVLAVFSNVNLLIFSIEFLLGCLITCTMLGAGVYGLIRLLWRQK